MFVCLMLTFSPTKENIFLCISNHLKPSKLSLPEVSSQFFLKVSELSGFVTAPNMCLFHLQRLHYIENPVIKGREEKRKKLILETISVDIAYLVSIR